MAEYAVECVDKKDGKPYAVLVEADSAEIAVAIAAKEHVAGRAVAIAARPSRADNAAVVDQLRAMQLQQAYQHQRVHGFSPARALSLGVVVVISVVIVLALLA